MKTILDEYYTHEAILENIKHVEKEEKIVVSIKFCEWQIEELEENKDSAKGIEIIFKNIKNISSTQIFTYNNEFILEIKIYKNKSQIILDTKEYIDVIFNFKDVEFKILY